MSFYISRPRKRRLFRQLLLILWTNQIMKNFLLFAFLVFVTNLAIAQTNYCASVDGLKNQIANDSTLPTKLRLIENQIQEQIHSGGRAGIIRIPIVFHVIHNGDAYGTNENITDEQIYSQIDALNRDFRKHNLDTSLIPAEFKALAADMEIEFCIARFDTNGNITSGITRHNLGAASWDRPLIESTMKPTTIWNSDFYLNIWTCQLSGSLSSVLGYAQFPGMARSTDGVVLRYDCCGTTGNIRPGNELGRVATHEVAHWMNLLHIWGDDNGSADECGGSDLVDDTPNERVEYYGRPTFPQTSCGSHDMFMNYMDYVDDSAKFMFTKDQVTRARAALFTQRAAVLTTINCNLNVDAQFERFISPSDSICTNNLLTSFVFKNNALENITYQEALYSIDGAANKLAHWTGFLHFREEGIFSLPIESLGDGLHTISVTLFNPNHIGSDDYAGNDLGTISFQINGTSIGASTPVSEGFEAPTLPANWTIQNPNGDMTWQLYTGGGAYATSSQCMLMDNFNPSLAAINKKDAFITDDYSLSNPNIPHLNFDVAYTRRSPTRGDTLSVFASLDCGHTWTLIWKQGSAELSTTGSDLNSVFTPTNTQWKNVFVDLTPFGHTDKIRFKFENFSQVGNRLFVDNINLKSYGVSIQDLKQTKQIQLFPNPATTDVNIELSSYFEFPVSYSIKNDLGQIVKTGILTENTSNISTANILDGLYFFAIESANHKIYAQKLMIQHQ